MSGPNSTSPKPNSAMCVEPSALNKVMAQAFAENPGQSIPQLFAHPYDVKAAYSFFDRPETDPERLQIGHGELVHERLSNEPGTYLLVEDGSETSFSGMNKPIEGLGFIGNAREGLQGFLLHSVLAVRWVGDDTTARARRRRSVVHPWRFWAWPPRATGCANTSRGGEGPRPRTGPRSDERVRARIG